VRDPLKWIPVKRQITHQHYDDDRVMSGLIDSIKTDRDLSVIAPRHCAILIKGEHSA
jgi:hypothetical protein